ncbi:hypothetical protein SELMODRAFT_170018 [Selaginella moellendorffii]|uniref:Prenylcysteine lyase domain-containing protein n=2 Tax=Selaginella moellendorffii TaxID=88036 RepID=D8RBT9_SELML|nr:farnesylcysteine lyase [Selaginella moellendorffii]EFJ30564.1 hypothetical protein SELMODRAFT_170018 [Selaginella moellendorffii]|eukprot:XP_024528861.1 farnesylcysteine lyase [Selaginella moellendorffii]
MLAGASIVALALLVALGSCDASQTKVCIVGSGIGGASAAHFLRKYSGRPQNELHIHVYERNSIVGGRMAMVDLLGDRFEAGASILHPKNLHTVHFVGLLGLKQKTSPDSETFGLWDGKKFVVRTMDGGSSFITKKIAGLINALGMLWRYGSDLFRMRSFVSQLLKRFLHFYDEGRTPYSSVKDMLESVELYGYTQHTLVRELLREGLSVQIITEIVTMITRINYGQNVSISGLAGAVSLCGSGDDLWAVEGGNWQMADGLIKLSNASLGLSDTVLSVVSKDGVYEVMSSSGKNRTCNAVIIAASLDEEKIVFSPSVDLPKRSMHHTFVTFVRGLVSRDYFGLKDAKLPDLIATLEVPGIPFISISVLKSYNATDNAYKVFSRASLSDEFLDKLFSVRRKTIRLNWAAYPQYNAPETFAPVILDGNHLYYVNSFENAASTMETSAVAAENVARLLLMRLSTDGAVFNSGLNTMAKRGSEEL